MTLYLTLSVRPPDMQHYPCREGGRHRSGLIARPAGTRRYSRLRGNGGAVHLIDVDAARIALIARYPDAPHDDRAVSMRISRELERKKAGLVHDERIVAIYEEWRKQQ